MLSALGAAGVIVCRAVFCSSWRYECATQTFVWVFVLFLSIKREGNCTVEYCESHDGCSGISAVLLRHGEMPANLRVQFRSAGNSSQQPGIRPNLLKRLSDRFSREKRLLKNTRPVFICVQLVLLVKSLITCTRAASYVLKLLVARIQFSTCVIRIATA